jgi:hypothetical protein
MTEGWMDEYGKNIIRALPSTIDFDSATFDGSARAPAALAHREWLEDDIHAAHEWRWLENDDPYATVRWEER